MILGLSLALYTVGYWRTPAALLLPLFVVFGWVAIAQVMLYREPFPNGQGYWGEQIALYESRMFDVLALVSVLHLAVLAGVVPRVSRLAWVTAVPQAALLVFLYHARSSLGWQYLALFSLVTLRFGWWVVQRCGESERSQSPAAPLFVAALLALSLIGLKQCQRAVYHADYRHDYGQRTFWHKHASWGWLITPCFARNCRWHCATTAPAVDLVLAPDGRTRSESRPQPVELASRAEFAVQPQPIRLEPLQGHSSHILLRLAAQSARRDDGVLRVIHAARHWPAGHAARAPALQRSW